jgi:hypothetical protein
VSPITIAGCPAYHRRKARGPRMTAALFTVRSANVPFTDDHVASKDVTWGPGFRSADR